MGISARLNRLDELANEYWLGISTIEYDDKYDPMQPDFRGYAPTAYRDWRIIRRHLDVDVESCFVDYGAGLGRSTILAAREQFKRVVGVDLNRDLVTRGNINVQAARGLKCPVEIICADATAFDIPDDAGVLYFCNPFAGDVLAAVLKKIEKWIEIPRPLQIVCNLPEHGAFEHRIRMVEWLDVDKCAALTNERKCLIFSPCP